jgi:MFS family permease
VLVVFVQPRAPVTEAGEPAPVPSLRRAAGLLGDARYRRLLVAGGALSLATASDAFIFLVLQEQLDLGASLFPLLFVGSAGTYMVLAVPMGRLADRVGRARVLVAGHGALLAAYLLGALPTGGLGLTLVVLMLLGVFYAATDGVLPALISRLVPDEARGSGIAAAQTVVALARFASSVAFGLLWSLQGPAWSLLLFAGLLLLAVPGVAWLLRGIDKTEVNA